MACSLAAPSGGCSDGACLRGLGRLSGGACVAEQHHGEQGQSCRYDDADRGGGVQPVGERRRAVSSSAEPSPCGSPAAAAAAPARLSCAAAAAWRGTPMGIVWAVWRRYTAVPTLPITATPRATPSSPPVSDSDDADPPSHAGTEPTIRSVPSTQAGVTPTKTMTTPATATARPDRA